MPEPTSKSASSHRANRWHNFLELAVSSTEASGGALWKVEEKTPQLYAQHQLGERPLDQVHQQWSGHVECLNSVIQTSESKSLEAQFEQAKGAQALRLYLLPIASGAEVQLILELFLPIQKEKPLDQIEDSVRQLLLWASPANNTRPDAASIDFATWLTQIHSHLDLRVACFSITNETKNWSHWDRVSLLIREGRNYDLRSVSGVDVIDRRSTTATSLERLANSLQNINKPQVSTEEDQHPDLEKYRSRVQAKQVVVIPLVGDSSHAKKSDLGLLVFDHFDKESNDLRSVEDLTLAARHISVALEHALSYSSLQGNGFQKLIGTVLSLKFAKTALVLVILASFVAFLCLFKTELTITGTGYLEPVHQRDIFAVSNGLIQKLHVTPGQSVDAGEKLLTLRSPELEFEANRLRGELATVRQQRADLETLRTDPRRIAESQRTADELAAREKELVTVAASLEKQIELLKLQARELILESPIAGEIVTWNLDAILTEDRPVNRTDRLLSVAQLSSDWHAKLHIDYRDTGPVLEAIEQDIDSLTFLTADAPESSKTGEITDVSPQIETDSISGTYLMIIARVERDTIPNVRPGTSILYRIQCGQASIGYVWFRRLIDRIQSWWVLR